LSLDILRGLHPKEVIYADVADTRAWGRPGAGQIYVKDGGEVKHFEIDAGKNGDTTTLEIYIELKKTLDRFARQEKLVEIPAGYGNYAFAQPRKTKIFIRDDDELKFLYKTKTLEAQITPSCPGVYYTVAGEISRFEVDKLIYVKYLEEHKHEMSLDELRFFVAYVQALKNGDDGLIPYKISLETYGTAVSYLLYQSHEILFLNSEDYETGEAAIAQYRLGLAIRQVGWKKIHKFFEKFIENKKANLWDQLAAILPVDVRDAYSTLRVEETTIKSLEGEGERPFVSDFIEPKLVKYSQEAHQNILQEITMMSPREIEENTEEIAYYFFNYAVMDDALMLTDALPAAAAVIERLPMEVGTYAAERAFWLAGDIINRAWMYLSEDEAAQQKYSDFVYDIYWSKVRSLWPLEWIESFTFNSEHTQKMFEEAVGFVMSTKGLKDRSPEMANFLKRVNEYGMYPIDSVRHAAYTAAYHDLSDQEQFEKIINEIEPAEYADHFWYPESDEEAKLVLDEAFLLDGGRLGQEQRQEVLRSLLRSPHKFGVGEYILKYINNRFDDLMMICKKDAAGSDADVPADLINLNIYMNALAQGITEENELPVLRAIYAKAKKAAPMMADDLDLFYNYARKRRRKILFQRSALMKIFP
ncbi:hypothetical protein IJ135_01195, partial [Candidatus Saccharibacteria bacterium]|nr:hypothetical protein [Candidatus Saccharibacteria bacterium]